MKRREIQELKNRASSELEKMLREKDENLRKLKYDLVAGKLKKVSSIKELKKDIARIKTFINLANNKSK
ncbi:50S ribosomal protein L29 [Patescibacteria group bacterium]|nr:50S ribosomal protein L29 [Patescibacteria group bacterium]MCL5733490.1 50S ribosomal protein L29 [Patescibacteria group bacterium]